MAYKKNKLDHYSNLGGINTKVSPYKNNVTEFRDLSNVDFRTPGSLTQRDGITQFIAQGVSGRIKGMFSLYGNQPVSASLTYQPSLIIYQAGTRAYFRSGTSSVVFQSGLADTDQNYTTRSYGAWVFYANGSNFKKFNGATFDFNIYSGPSSFVPGSGVIEYDSQNYCLPTGPDIWGYSLATTSATPAITGNWAYKASWIDRRGFMGPPGRGITVVTSGFQGNILLSSSTNSIVGWTVPASFGIGGTQFFGYNGQTFTAFVNAVLWRTNGVTADYFFRSLNLTSYGGNPLVDVATNGTSFEVLGVTPIATCISFTLAPKYLEVFNNSLFMAGFTVAPNVIAFSDIGEPESVQPQSNIQVGSGYGDNITALMFFNGRLIVGKENSLFYITGDNPTNYALIQITDEYGILNNCAAVYDDVFLFLDKKGICEFNGANLKIISNEIEDVFNSMNITAAKGSAVINHVKRLNQIWIGIPCNGATQNNCTVVYDYLMKKWTKYEGYNPSYFISTDIGFNRETEVIGDYSGLLHFMSSSFVADNGNAFTVLIKSRWDNTDKMSTTMQYRQFYLDQTKSTQSSTLTVEFLPNYQDGVSLTAYIDRSQYQQRIDFGLPATSMSVKITKVDTADKLVMHGFVIASRLQRETSAFSQE